MSARWTSRTLRAALAAALAAGLTAYGSTGATAGPGPATTEMTIGVSSHGRGATLDEDFQGFSVESADLAHGFLTAPRMAQRLRTLGPGVLRLGGYSMDLVWPAFGQWRDTPAPAEAIGGTVDQHDLTALKSLLDESGWKATLGVPLKSVIDPSKIKSPTKDPSPKVAFDQAVAEVRAAAKTLGHDLLAVEVGNEYDNVTTLTAAEMWDVTKRYQEAIREAAPHARLKMAGPSANTSKTNPRLDEYVTAALADQSTTPQRVHEELASHWYAGSHCGSSTMTIAQLMSATTHANTATKLSDITAIGARLHGGVPMTINESNSASCSGMPGVSDSYATSLWSLDYLLQAAQSGISRVQFHTNTAAICGDFKPRDSADYPISYRYYGAFCAEDQRALDADELSASPLYYGLWAFRQVPSGRFVDLTGATDALDDLRAYAIRSRHGALTAVLINVQDPADGASTQERVRLDLPGSYHHGREATLQSSAPEGLAALDADTISLGGRQVSPQGCPTGRPVSHAVAVHSRTATVTVAPGTAQLVTFSH